MSANNNRFTLLLIAKQAVAGVPSCMHPLNQANYERLSQFTDMSRYQNADVNPFFLCPRDFTWTGWSCPGAEQGQVRLEVKCSFTEIEPPQEGQKEYKYHPMRYLLHYDGTIDREMR